MNKLGIIEMMFKFIIVIILFKWNIVNYFKYWEILWKINIRFVLYDFRVCRLVLINRYIKNFFKNKDMLKWDKLFFDVEYFWLKEKERFYYIW